MSDRVTVSLSVRQAKALHAVLLAAWRSLPPAAFGEEATGALSAVSDALVRRVLRKNKESEARVLGVGPLARR